MAQVQKRPIPPSDIAGPPAVPAAAAPAAQTQAVDALLDDIQSVLETNADEFVRGFVQKGGQ
jgi:ubiquitin-like protein Pup